jgi:hypothetical protein
MPRNNRPRGRRSEPEDDDFDISRALMGRLHVERKRDGGWNVQPIGSSSVKTYTCPACGLEIPPGTAHVATWRADGILGERSDIDARRHWHTHCWKIRS